MSSNRYLSGAALPSGGLAAPEGGDATRDGMNELCCISSRGGGDEPGQATDLDQLASYAAPAATIPAALSGPRHPCRARIARISNETAAAISSQQVVIDLRSICKELVENALDAGATSIEVRLMDCGLGGVEVRDNGNGISPENLEFLVHISSFVNVKWRFCLTFKWFLRVLSSRARRFRLFASSLACQSLPAVEQPTSELASSSIRVVDKLREKLLHARYRLALILTPTTTSVTRAGAYAVNWIFGCAEDRSPMQSAFDGVTGTRGCPLLNGPVPSFRGGRSTFLATKGTSSGLMEAALTVYGSKQLAACTEIKLSGNEPGREWRQREFDLDVKANGIRRLEAVMSRPPHGHFFVKRRAVEFPPLLQKLLNKYGSNVQPLVTFTSCASAAIGCVYLVLFWWNRKDKQLVLLSVERDIAQALLEAVSTTLAPSVGSLEFELAEKQRQLSINPFSLSQLPESSLRERSGLSPVRAEETELEQDSQQTQQHKPQQQQGQLSAPMEREERLVSGRGGTTCFSGGCSFVGSTPSIESDSIPFAQARGDRGVVRSDGEAHCNERLEPHQGKGESAGSLTALLPSEGMRPRQPLSLARRQRSRPRHSHDAALEEQEHRRLRSLPDDLPVQSDLAVALPESAANCSPFVEERSSALSGSSATLAIDEEADFIAAEVIAAAVGECFLDLEEVYSVDELDASARRQEQSSTADDDWRFMRAASAWADAPTDFSINAGDAALGALKDTNFFLFRKDFFSDLKLVGQFNEGFIIAALRHTRRARIQPALGRDPEDALASDGQCISSCGSGDRTETVNSLFIVDQHASDEKRIFESLNKEFCPQMQPLIAPLRLNLPAELIAAVEAFAPHLSANGFGWILCSPESPQWPLQLSQSMFALSASHNFSTAKTRQARVLPFKSLSGQQQRQAESLTLAKESKLEDADTRDACAAEDDEEIVSHERQCFLTGLPVIEGRQLTASDFLDFLAALASEDQGKAMWKGTMPQPSPPAPQGPARSQRASPHHRVLQYRPSRVWDILASKACRSAVMIGDALAPHKQLAILGRMANLQLPFNCPHGRPTMRHLVDVSHEEFGREGCGKFTGKICHQQFLQATEIYGNTRTSRALNNFGFDASDPPCRKKRLASPAQHLDNQLRKIHQQDPHRSQHFPAARHMHEDGQLRTACRASSVRAVPVEDDSPSLFFEDDDSLAQEELQAAGSTIGTALESCREEVETVEQESDAVTERACNGLCLTFIG
ncbi:hypothetical protein Emag_000599 [Eimeria magna]